MQLLGIFCYNRNAMAIHTTLKKLLISSVREHTQCTCEFILKLFQLLVLLCQVGTCSKGVT